MWDHETNEEGAKDGMDADDVGDPSADEDEKQRDHNHDLVGTVLEAAGASGEPDEGGLNDEEKDENPTDGTQQDVERSQASVGIDQRYCQREENPSYNVVSDTCCEHNDTDFGIEKLGLGKDTRKHREGSDSHGDTVNRTKWPKDTLSLLMKCCRCRQRQQLPYRKAAPYLPH